jgi:cell division protein FtsL
VKRHSCRIGPTHRKGFVLVLTLAMILIAVTITARSANRSLTRTLQSIEEEAHMQSRWGKLSLQRALLSRATQVFHAIETVERTTSPSRIWHDGQIELSGTTYRLRLSDESARLNLNTLRRTRSADDYQRFIADTVSTPRRSIAQEKNSPERGHEINESLESWGQVFENSTPPQLIDHTTDITCWGEGRLNLQRASDQSVRTLLEPLIGQTDVDAILRQRQEQLTRNDHSPTEPQPSLVPTIAAGMVTHESRCYSLWLVSEESGEVELHIREMILQGSVMSSFRW